MMINGGGMKTYNYKELNYSFERTQRQEKSLSLSTKNQNHTTENSFDRILPIHSNQASQDYWQQSRKLPPIKQIKHIQNRQREIVKARPVKVTQVLTQPTPRVVLEPRVKRALSQECKDNFLQFLLIQKAGKVGDLEFFEKLRQIYNKQLFPSQDEKKKRKKNGKARKHDIPYLKIEDERDEELQQQIQELIMGRAARKTETPLDEFIVTRHEGNVGQLGITRREVARDQHSKMDQFEI